jgi:hypothetical protein
VDRKRLSEQEAGFELRSYCHRDIRAGTEIVDLISRVGQTLRGNRPRAIHRPVPASDDDPAYSGGVSASLSRVSLDEILCDLLPAQTVMGST